MTLWKLERHIYGTEEYSLRKGDEVTVGRNVENVISLSSIVVSRNHCLIKVEEDKVLITDLKSSNGVFVNNIKIPSNIPYAAKDSDMIGFGWAVGARLVNIENKEKYIFKLTKQRSTPSVIERIQFQNESDDLEDQIAHINGEISRPRQSSPILASKPPLKRKSEDSTQVTKSESVIDLISDSDTEVHSKEVVAKKIKLETISEDPVKDNVKEESRMLESDMFRVKQEYIDYDEDEAIQIDSDSDSESDHWLMRLSQSSPGKPFLKVKRESKVETKPEESSYSQIDDDLMMDDFLKIGEEEENEEDEEYLEDIITIPTEPPVPSTSKQDECLDIDDPIIIVERNHTSVSPTILEDEGIDLVDAASGDNTSKANDSCVSDAFLDTLINKNIKQTQIIDAQPQLPKRRSAAAPVEKKSSPVQKRHSKDKKHSSSKKHITNSQKEERKKKLKEIASKEKEHSKSDNAGASSSNKVVAAKVSATNRGAFLTDTVEPPSKSTKKKETKPREDKPSKPTTDEKKERSSKRVAADKSKTESSSSSTKSISSSVAPSSSPTQSKPSRTQSKSSPTQVMSSPSQAKSSPTQKDNKRIPLNKVKPLTGKDDLFSGKPCSMVQPLPAVKPKKKVRFSENAPEVRTFEIEPGNKMKKTSLVKTTFIDSLRQGPVYSMDKLTLMKILRWNPHWFEEQMNNNDPPPILGHNNTPMSIFHYFKSHHQYMQQVGDLLLMEIWECLTQGYLRVRNINNDIPMRIESLPPIPTHERCVDLYTISVNVSMPSTELKSLFRVGDILLVRFGQEPIKNLRLFFVHNIKNLPAPPHNKNSFFSVSIQTMFTEKMKFLKLGELMVAKSLDHINKELQLFEAMEFMARSPLGEAILRPHPMHFPIENNVNTLHSSCWTQTLNPSQQTAVAASVRAALSERPSIQMVQGPPGTGKSSVITAIVMSYFYDANSKRLPNRGKILLCATSNTAVDELVLRLLHIRQSLPKEERFRMVRVGRLDAMNPRARDVSSTHLAERDAARHRPTSACPALQAEISHLEAKINMWRTAAQDAKDAERVAYCQSRVDHLTNRISLLKNGQSEVRPEHIIHAERRIIEGANIVATTLASAQNHKMKALKGSIALCIVDEAGQALEPETLAVLSLNVTHLTLVGDPQQLPGYICSQRAKKHGLGESLFARLTSVAEQWPEGNPVVLLNQQYRMHANIVDYPNRAFYGGKILTSYKSNVKLPIPAYTIMAISSGDKGQAITISFSLYPFCVVGGANELESWGVSRVVLALHAAVKQQNLNIAVITPYNAQKDLIKKNIRTLQDSSTTPINIEVNTVDSFQGQERDIVIVSLARSLGAGFLTDTGRMNVMLTRAKHAMVLCLNPTAMLGNHQWRTLVEDAQRRNLYRTLPNKFCHNPNKGPNVNLEDILHYITRNERRTSRS